MNILLLVSRIVLIAQSLKRLLNYAIPKEKVGVYFGERKEIKEITISTYQSVIYNPGTNRYRYGAEEGWLIKGLKTGLR